MLAVQVALENQFDCLPNDTPHLTTHKSNGTKDLIENVDENNNSLAR